MLTHLKRNGETLVDWANGGTPGKSTMQARWELSESRRLLAERLHKPVKYFAWPAGFYDEVLIRLATDSDYTALLTIDDASYRSGYDLRRMRRTMVYGGCNDQIFAQIVVNGRYRDCHLASTDAMPTSRDLAWFVERLRSRKTSGRIGCGSGHLMRRGCYLWREQVRSLRSA